MNVKINRKFQKYKEVVIISQNELFATPSNFIGRLVVHAMRISVFGILYTYVFKSSGKLAIDGFSAVNAVWSLALVQIVHQCSRNIFVQIKDEILSGQIETKLNKPYSFLFFSFLDAIGQAPIKSIGFSIVTFVVLAIFFGVPYFSPIQLLGILPLIVLGLILYTLFQQLIGLFAFWIENPDPIFWITNKLSWIVNGTFVPLAILPISFRRIADIFPLSAPFFAGRIFEIDSVYSFVKYLLIQVIWIVVLVSLINFVYKKGVAKISINGG